MSIQSKFLGVRLWVKGCEVSFNYESWRGLGGISVNILSWMDSFFSLKVIRNCLLCVPGSLQRCENTVVNKTGQNAQPYTVNNLADVYIGQNYGTKKS